MPQPCKELLVALVFLIEYVAIPIWHNQAFFHEFIGRNARYLNRVEDCGGKRQGIVGA